MEYLGGGLLIKKSLVNFEQISWERTIPGLRQKIYLNGKQRLRLLEFTEGFVEEDWCTKGHAGYVLEGSFALDFNGHSEKLKQGDVLFIPEGQEYKHKAILAKDERVLLLLFEII